MHDIVEFESRGVPAVFVASTEFVDAAKAQAEALGFDPAAVFVPHPIQDRTDEEIKTLANDAVGSILATLQTT